MSDDARHAAGTGAAGLGQQQGPLLRMSYGTSMDLVPMEESAPRPDPYAFCPGREPPPVPVNAPPWAHAVTGFDRQTLDEAFLNDQELRDVGEFPDRVERLQRIMKAKKEVRRCDQDIARIMSKRRVGGQSKSRRPTS